MPTPQQIRAEVESGPLAAELAPLAAAGRDADVATALNRADLPGYVPARDLSAVLARRNLWGVVILAARFRLLPNGQTCPLNLFTLFCTCELAAHGTFSPPLRMEIAPLAAAADALVAAGLMTADDRAAVLADEVRISRAEQAWGYGVAVSADDVARALRG